MLYHMVCCTTHLRDLRDQFSFCNLCPEGSCRWHVSEPGVQHEGWLGEMIVADQMMPIAMPKAALKDANLHQRTSFPRIVDEGNTYIGFT